MTKSTFIQSGMTFLPGMTLIELLATISIIAVLVTIGLPPLNQMIGRESLISGQREVQTAVYKLNQNALSPPQYTIDPAHPYITVAYGLAFIQVPKSGGTTNFGNCTVTSASDYMAIVKFVTSTSTSTPAFSADAGQIRPVFNPLNPGDSCTIADVKTYPNDIFPLPRNIVFNTQETTSRGSPPVPFPWLMIIPIHSAGETPDKTVYGRMDDILSASNFKSTNGAAFIDPLEIANADETLVLAHKFYKVGSSQLCRGIKFNNAYSGIDTETKIVTPCTLP